MDEQELKGQKVLIEPVIDSQTPPIGVDNVILRESSTGAIRLSGFSGNIFSLRTDVLNSKEEGVARRIWARPVCVIDLNPNAVRQLDEYLAFRLSGDANTVEELLRQFPETRENLRTLIEKIEAK